MWTVEIVFRASYERQFIKEGSAFAFVVFELKMTELGRILAKGRGSNGLRCSGGRSLNNRGMEVRFQALGSGVDGLYVRNSIGRDESPLGSGFFLHGLICCGK